MEVNKKQLADIFGASIRTIQNWQEQGMPVLRGGGKGNEVLYDSAAVIKWYAERDAEIENEKLRREVEELRQAMGAGQRHELQCRSAACQCRLPASGHADRPDRLHRRHDGSQ